MPNRIIKESICTSDNIENLTLEEEVFFYRLIVNCDDFGRADARSQILRAKCFPLRTDKIKNSDIDKWLKKLDKEGLIILYEVDEKPYLQMSTWDKHQQIRAKRSKFPAPDLNLISDDISGNHSQENVPVIQSNPIQSESEYESKNIYAEFVRLKDEEYKKLVDQLGENGTQDMIEKLNNYIGSKGKKYKSHYHTILNWVNREKKEQPAKGRRHLNATNWDEYKGDTSNQIPKDWDSPDDG